MIDRVTIEHSTYADPPVRFEAGTPPIAEVIALGAAIDYVSNIGMEAIRLHEQDILSYAHQRLSAVEGLQLIGTAPGNPALFPSPWTARIHMIFRRLLTIMAWPSGRASLCPAPHGPA